MILKLLILMKIELSSETFSDFVSLFCYLLLLLLLLIFVFLCVCFRAAEFIVYKLKEMGKIDEKDISGIMEEFEQLDYDESGNLTNSDIVLAQIQR